MSEKPETPEAAAETPPAETQTVETQTAETLTFEAALAELERVVAALEAGDVPLEESIALYGRGSQLQRHCQRKLEEAEARVALITEGADGRIGTRPADIV